MEKEKINLLWTGGFDSSYRLLELSRMDVIVQPYYVLDESRRSTPLELKAMKRIEAWLKKCPDTIATLLPLRIVKDSDVRPDAEITAAWKECHQKYELGSQYDFLARFAKQEQLKLEVGVQCAPRGKVGITINGEGRMEKIAWGG